LEVQEKGILMHTSDSLKKDAMLLGIESGDTIFIHSSFKSIGPAAVFS
jgi:aminoglycoside N3'-acetyltransferase